MKTLVHSLVDAMLFVFLAVTLVFVGPWLDQEDSQQSREAAQQQSEEQRFERAAQAVCGPNAAWRLTSTPNEITCLTKHGRPTIKAHL